MSGREASGASVLFGASLLLALIGISARTCEERLRTEACTAACAPFQCIESGERAHVCAAPEGGLSVKEAKK